MRIYVGNLAFRSNAEDVRKAFAVHGQVTSVELAIDRETGRSAGYAFVEMPDDEEAQSAISRLNGKEINSRVVSVTAATEAPVLERPPFREPRTDRPRSSDRRPSSNRPSSNGPNADSPWSRRPRGNPPDRR